MEMLGRMVSSAMSGNLLSGFSMGTWIDISHLLFTDGTLIFCGVDPRAGKMGPRVDLFTTRGDLQPV